MSDNRQIQYPSEKFRFIDGFVLVFFILTALFGLYLFQQDLMRTFEIRGVEPAGIITLRNNVVQRRHDDRVLWDRIFVNSFVYPGDLIRVASVSSANIDIASNEIFLNENTLIRIEGSLDNLGNFRVELQQGNLSISSGANSSGITLNIMGNQIQTTAGTILDATAGEDGISLQVNEGKVEFKQEGQSREITEGSMLSFNARGEERVIPSAIVRRPVPNARYLKDDPQERHIVNFEWSRVNVSESEPVRLEIANDFGYKNIVSVIYGLRNEAQAEFDVGQWYWRIMYQNTVLRKGWINVIDSSSPAQISPAPETLFRYHADNPQLRLQWEKSEWASAYLIEISDEPDFSSPVIQKQLNANTFITSDLGQGEWYWRVKPVFSSVFIGDASFSSEASFIIEHTNDPKESGIIISAEAAEKARAANAGAARVSSANFSVSASLVHVFSPVTEPMPAIRPEPAVQPPAASAGTGKGQQYTIRPGDTLGRLAREHYGNAMLWTIIVEANNIKNPDLIYPGQVFFIP